MSIRIILINTISLETLIKIEKLNKTAKEMNSKVIVFIVLKETGVVLTIKSFDRACCVKEDTRLNIGKTAGSS